ncbi:MAG TPA: hydroxyphenylacetyl-CoA thioesterase PaaI [Stellaceae bacterium]|nr:hydroxyphenylacetyl-CoA thioesterase PaaI [Stellaceae bacterium]
MTPDERANAAAAALRVEDRVAHDLAMTLVEVGAGCATLAMTVTEQMTNGHGIVHGGYIFTLADSAFAYACNSYGETTVAAQCSITFLRPARAGDRLVANAREIGRAGRSGIYDVSVAVDDGVVAEFRGHSRTVGGSFLPAAEPAP